MGYNQSKQKTTPVTWQKIMTPWQIGAMEKAAPTMLTQGMQGFAGMGLSPAQKSSYRMNLMDTLSSLGGSQRSALRSRGAAQGLTGGAREESEQGLAGGILSQLGAGLQGLKELDLQQANQKVQNFLSWITWSPPTAQKSEGRSWGLSITG